MVAYKCKLCGGTIIPNPDGKAGKCEYCKTISTLPKEKDDKIQNILNRANDFRMVCDFDRAIYEYEKVIEIAEDEPEAHWGLMLSRYGVEYIQDPQSFAFKPTLHRISSVSVLEDPDYLAAVKYASLTSAYTYKKDAAEIETTMRKLLQIAASEEPYDVFISYKKEENGVRTTDSYFAHDLYNKLIGAGYKVFFAQETLKLSAGEEYEPKIYAAIISAKVMIVVGTKEKYFNSVWVKNEWSRFAELIEHGEDKIIIPVFDNFDINNLPNRLSKYQALQKSDLEFLNILLQTVDKHVGTRKSKVSFDKNVSTEKVALERGYLSLEDGEFSRADMFFEKALNVNPYSSEAYFGKLMVELKARKQEDIILADKPLNTYKKKKKAVRFADQKLKVELLQYEEKVRYNLDLAYFNKLILIFNQLKNKVDSNNFKPSYDDVLYSISDLIDKLKRINNIEKTVYYIKKCEELKKVVFREKQNAENERIRLEMEDKKKQQLQYYTNIICSVIVIIFETVFCIVFVGGGYFANLASLGDSPVPNLILAGIILSNSLISAVITRKSNLKFVVYVAPTISSIMAFVSYLLMYFGSRSDGILAQIFEFIIFTIFFGGIALLISFLCFKLTQLINKEIK